MTPYLENEVSLHESIPDLNSPILLPIPLFWLRKTTWKASQSMDLSVKWRYPPCGGNLATESCDNPQTQNCTLLPFTNSQRLKNCLLATAKQFVITKKWYLRSAVRHFSVPWSKFKVFFKNPTRKLRPAGHPITLTKPEEILIANSFLDNCKKPKPALRGGSQRPCAKILRTFARKVREYIPFMNRRPVDVLFYRFFRRNPIRLVKRLCILWKDKAPAMCPRNISEKYDRLKEAYKKYAQRRKNVR